MKRAHPEMQLQRAVVIYLRAVLLPPPQGPIWRAIDPLPGKSPKDGALAKSMGAQPGWPDLQFIWRGRFIGIELKQPGKYLSADQKKIHQDITSAGGIATICYSLQSVIEFLDVMNIPTREAKRAA